MEQVGTHDSFCAAKIHTGAPEKGTYGNGIRSNLPNANGVEKAQPTLSHLTTIEGFGLPRPGKVRIKGAEERPGFSLPDQVNQPTCSSNGWRRGRKPRTVRMWDVSKESQWMQHQMHMVYEMDTPGVQRNDTWPNPTDRRKGTLGFRV